MNRTIATKASLVAMLVVCGNTPLIAMAQQAPDQDWPCVQRKTPKLSIAQMWSGPAIDSSLNWRSLPKVAAIAPTVAARRTSLEEAGTLVEELASRSGRRERRKRLTALFAAVFDILERDRREVVNGIARYAREQNSLAGRINERSAEVEELVRKTDPDDFDTLDKTEIMQDALDWDVRAFNERAEALEYVCESPILIEKRIFALARIVMARLR